MCFVKSKSNQSGGVSTKFPYYFFICTTMFVCNLDVIET